MSWFSVAGEVWLLAHRLGGRHSRVHHVHDVPNRTALAGHLTADESLNCECLRLHHAFYEAVSEDELVPVQSRST